MDDEQIDKDLLHNDFNRIQSKCESIFNHMKILWNNNRKKMKNDHVGAELNIKMN
jgi:hypothetical protein